MHSAISAETLAQDVERDFLYPSQTWASLNTGTPYELHKIHWYNDPKPSEYPLYWKVVADHGFSVGLINTLHSSPAGSWAESHRTVPFVVPDCFASDSYTKPGYLEPFQKLNLQAVKENSRVSTLRAPVKDVALTLLNAPRFGIRAQTLSSGTRLMAGILLKRVNRERLRNFQFPLVADIFFRQFEKHEPDLAVLFTNHVAANMHRYWYGLFPEDFQDEVYGQEWVKKYGGEIDAAMDLLDAYMGKLMGLAERTNRVLVIVSSMGQQGNRQLTATKRSQQAVAFRLQDVRKLMGVLLPNAKSFRVLSAMVPQYVLAFSDAPEASRVEAEFKALLPATEGLAMVLDRNENILTLSAIIESGTGECTISGRKYSFQELGFLRFEVDDHHSGRHCPEGTLIIYNSQTSKLPLRQVNYLEYAPAMLSHFKLDPLPHMMKPSFTI